MRLAPRLVTGFLAGALVLAAAHHADAYVRSVNDNGLTMCWPRSSMTLVLAAGAMPDFLDKATLINATLASAETWNTASVIKDGKAQRCTQLQLHIDVDEIAERADAIKDRDNRITFRRTFWGREPCDPTVEKCMYSPDALAITSTYSQKSDGVLVGGDIEINGKDFKWGDVAKNGDRPHPLQDLQNALTHELGHFIGLDHTCYLPTNRPRMKDHHGQLVPDCNPGLPAEVLETTMYASADPGDIAKRDLAADDRDAVCTLFPVGQMPPCGSDDGGGGGCALAPGAGAGGAGLGAALALAGLALVSRRRRRR